MRRCPRCLVTLLFRASSWRRVPRSCSWLRPRPRAAHGPVPSEPPTPANLLLGWTFPPLPTLAILVALVWWAWAVGRVNGAHPQSRVPRRRTIAFVAAMTALAFALLSGIERYDTTLFSVHMVQHLLLVLVAAPLIALGRADHAAPPGRLPGDAAAGRAADPSLAGDAVHQLPGRGVDRLRGGDVGRALLAAVRCGAREPPRARPRARPVPRGRPAVLVAGRRCRPRARGAWRTRAVRSTRSCRCPRTRSWR